MDQGGMKHQLAQIHKLMQFTDPELCSYLGKKLNAVKLVLNFFLPQDHESI